MSDNEKTTRDFTDYSPSQVKLLDHEVYEIAAKHNIILRALRENLMTAKEIHDLYLVEEESGVDSETKAHSVTQQTIYRYLEELESNELIIVAGFRKTEGVKASERLYGRTANTFLMIPDIQEMENEEFDEEYKEFLFQMGKIIGNALDLDYNNLDREEFVSFYRKYMISRSKSVEYLYKKAQTDSSLFTIFEKMTLERINESMWYVQIFVPFLKNPELLANLKQLYKK